MAGALKAVTMPADGSRHVAHQLAFEDVLPAFSAPLTRAEDCPTSIMAAGMQWPWRLRAGRLLALAALAKHGPLTDYELAAITGRQQNSIGKRRTELTQAGVVRSTGLTRAAPSGAPATVWALTEDGQRLAQGIRGRQ